MSGVACAIPHLAIMQSDGIPTTAAELPDFDRRLRKCCTQSEIVNGLVEAGYGDAVCAILKKNHFSPADRSSLYTMLDALYDD